MKPSSFLWFVALPFSAVSFSALAAPDNVRTEIDNSPKVAQVEKPEQALPDFAKNQDNQTAYTLAELQANPDLTRHLLVQAIYSRNAAAIEKLLAVYQTFPHRDETLVQFSQAKIARLKENYAQAINQYRAILAKDDSLNPVRIELAEALFLQKQDKAAKAEFEKARTAENLPPMVKQLIDAYLAAIAERDSWDIDFSINYLRDQNVNNVGNSREIEETGFIKNNQMLPQTAHGFAYNFGLSRDFNLTGSHYFSFQNELNGKSYWDNHDYDDLANRTSLGYSYKTAKQTFRLLPFYEKRWYGGEKYRWTNGVRAELTHWFSPNWQISNAAEWSKLRYFDSTAQNGNNKLLSSTLVWLRNPNQFFYLGGDFNAERTQVRQYSGDLKNIRLGWGQSWGWGISTRLSFSYGKRDYKDIARLGGVLNLGKVRSDKIYGVNVQLWKRDWHILGITPKLVYSWRKQDSNIPTMYSYIDRNVNLIFEKSF